MQIDKPTDILSSLSASSNLVLHAGQACVSCPVHRAHVYACKQNTAGNPGTVSHSAVGPAHHVAGS